MIHTLFRWIREGSPFWNDSATFAQVMKEYLAIAILSLPVAMAYAAIQLWWSTR